MKKGPPGAAALPLLALALCLSLPAVHGLCKDCFFDFQASQNFFSSNVRLRGVREGVHSRRRAPKHPHSQTQKPAVTAVVCTGCFPSLLCVCLCLPVSVCLCVCVDTADHWLSDEHRQCGVLGENRRRLHADVRNRGDDCVVCAFVCLCLYVLWCFAASDAPLCCCWCCCCRWCRWMPICECRVPRPQTTASWWGCCTRTTPSCRCTRMWR